MGDLWVFISVILLIIGVGSIFLFIVKNNELKRKTWWINAKIGDTCSVSAIDGSPHMNNVEIIEMDDDTVTIKVVVKKRWIYPPKN